MSLQVWLPLISDVHNQGVWNPPNQSCGSFTFTGTGKIGSTAAQGYIGWHLSEDILENTWSVAMWCKPISLGQYNNILFCKNISDSTDCHIYFSIISNTVLNIGVNGPSSSLSYSYSFTLSQWYHVAATYDGSRVTLYINGNEVNHTTVSTAKPSGRLNMQINGRSTNTGGTGSTGGATIQYNDFRLYDHCLSAAEVKEISQGLVLHYKLDQNITVGENIMPNSLNMGLGSANPSTGTWRTAGTNNMTRSRVAITDTPEGSGYGFQNSGIQTANDGSCYGIDNFPTEANTEYVISMWARITAGTEGYAGFAIQRTTPIAGWQVINKNYYSTKLATDGSWTRCWMSFKTNSATTRNIYIGITTGSTSVTTQMCNVHIEKGLLVDYNMIKDSSGYNYNGTITGNTEITFSSARYYQALNYDGGYIDTNMELNTNNSTISMWLNIPSLSTSYHILDARNSSETGKQPIYSYSNGSIQTGGSGKYVTSNSNFLETNKWIFIAIIQNGDNILLYKNGTLFQTIACANTSIIKPTIGARYTHSNIYHGQMSDFRIYCTALSADDILSLYHTSAKVDNKQNLHTFELIESSSAIKINKRGQTLCDELEENTATKFYKTNQIIETNEIIEL